MGSERILKVITFPSLHFRRKGNHGTKRMRAHSAATWDILLLLDCAGSGPFCLFFSGRSIICFFSKMDIQFQLFLGTGTFGDRRTPTTGSLSRANRKARGLSCT